MDEKTIARFWRNVDSAAPGCWQWQGRSNAGGYGVMSVAGRLELAHRFSWRLNKGTDPGTLCVCHKCDNPSCVRPSHLFLGSRADNLRDMFAKGRGRPGVHRGSANGFSKLTEDDVALIRHLHRTGMRQVDIAKRFGADQTNISMVVNRKTWKHIP